MTLSEYLNNKNQLVLLAIKYLLKTNNEPLTYIEIYEKIKSNVVSNAKRPSSNLSDVLGKYAKGSENQRNKTSHENFFEREGTPYKYWIIPELYDKLVNSDIEDIERYEIKNQELLSNLSKILDTNSKNIILSIKHFLSNNNQPLLKEELLKEIKDELKPKGELKNPTLFGFLTEYSGNSKKTTYSNNPKGYVFFTRTQKKPFKYSLTNELYEKLLTYSFKETEEIKIKKVLKTETNNNFLTVNDEEMKLKEALDIENQFITLSIEFLLKNKNKHYTSRAIFENIKSRLISNGATPESSLNSILGRFTEGSTHKRSQSDPNQVYYFSRDTSVKPYEYFIIPALYEKLLISDIDELESFYKDSLGISNDLISDIETFKELKEIKELKIQNPLNQAICILGESGNGKTFTTMATLENEEHDILYQILDEHQEHILYEYLPHEQNYELSKVGDFILKANSNPNKYFTIVFDECHKYLDKVNNSLLQCLSLERNNGVRFLQNDRRINNLYNDLEDCTYGKKIPDNLGFVFISSKPSNIEANEDFKNRLKFYEIQKDYSNKIFTIDYIKNIEYEFD
jgi:hypothetical protein